MTTDTPATRGSGAGGRKDIPAATEAALWVLSNGTCYAPGCRMPVVMEVRPKVYKKNVWVAHIFGVAPNTPRYEPQLRTEDRDCFANLLLLCLPHHSDVDDKKLGDQLYPPELLLKWKADHEGSNAPALAALPPLPEDQLTDLLTRVFTPPLERLEAITDRLERTGTATAQTVAELREVISVLTHGIEASIAEDLVYAAGVFERLLASDAAEVLPLAADKMAEAARMMGNFY